MSKKKPYFPNNWKKLKDVPEELFENIDFEDFMDWKIGGYELPSSINCVIRERDLNTGKVKEYVYSRPMAAKKKLEERMQSGEYEFTVCNGEAIHLLTPMEEDPYDDPLA